MGITERKKLNIWFGGLITALPLLLIAAHFAYDARDIFAFIGAASFIYIASTVIFYKSRNLYRMAHKRGLEGAHFSGLAADGLYGACIIIYGLAWIPVLGIILIRLSGIDYLSS